MGADFLEKSDLRERQNIRGKRACTFLAKLIAISGLIYSTITMTREFFSENNVTKVDIKEGNLDFPAITLCHDPDDFRMRIHKSIYGNEYVKHGRAFQKFHNTEINNIINPNGDTEYCRTFNSAWNKRRHLGPNPGLLSAMETRSHRISVEYHLSFVSGYSRNRLLKKIGDF
ncbi:hypothetical protein GQR58_014273 [Nymphon striatum]|nr:hypothetical protein GQR58_014273 [Nymphon striatum]